MRHFWQWLCGYVCVNVRGRQINRFLNLCTRNGISLWRITYDMEHSLRVNLRLRDFYNLKPYLRKTKSKLRIISKKGFPFWCFRHPRLKWFLCICFFVLCMGIYSLSFVWKIEIKGNDKVSTQEIIDCLQENHVEIGLKKQSVDCSGIELILREQFSQLGWVSVYFEYTNLCVEVKESLYDVVEHPETEYGKMYHLVANKPARINSIVTRTGKAVVTKGQLVKPGDILVLGQNEIIDDSGEIREIIYLKADALIYGDVEYDLLIPISEMEIAALKLAGDYREEDLLQLAYYKMSSFINKLEDNNVIILDTEIHLEKKEKNICFWAKIYAREQIGINIPVEEVAEYEFE